jgi:hypothetical protein
MAARKKASPVVPAPPPAVTGEDRIALIDAYRAGLILSWRRDVERGYCLTVPGRGDAYVEADQLAKYLRQLAPR